MGITIMAINMKRRERHRGMVLLSLPMPEGTGY